MKVPLVNLQRNYDKYRSEYNRILTETAASCQFVMGDAMRDFEEKFADYLGVKHVLGVGSGTDALTLLLKAHGAAGKTVLTQNNTFIATTLAIANAGANIAVCDVDENTYQLDLASYNGPTPDIVLPVHLYGYPYDVAAAASRYGKKVAIFEDACQAHGSILNGKRCGNLGQGAAFSFYPGKNLGAFGDGGAVAVNDDNLAEEIKALRNWGGKIKYVHDREGGNSRLDTIQAAILNFKLKHLDEWNAARNLAAARYRQLLGGCEALILPPEASADCVQNYHLFVIRLKTHNRDAALKQLHANDIFAGIHYPVPINKQVVYQDAGFAKNDYPVSARQAGEILSLPLFPEITNEEIDYVAETLLKILK